MSDEGKYQLCRDYLAFRTLGGERYVYCCSEKDHEGPHRYRYLVQLIGRGMA